MREHLIRVRDELLAIGSGHSPKVFERHRPHLLCVGEISWDLLELYDRLPQNDEACHPLFTAEGPGGCALNTAYNLAALGAECSLAGNPVGADRAGSEIVRISRDRGVTAGLKANPGVATPVCRCLVEKQSGERAFVLSHATIQLLDARHVADTIAPLASATRDGRFTHVFVQPYVREASRAYLDSTDGAPAWRLAQDLKVDDEFVGRTEALQLSMDDFPDVEFSAASVRAIGERYFRGRLMEIFLTAGAKGVAYMRAGDPPRLIPGWAAETIVDTTGCGDAFRAGLMFALACGAGVEKSIGFGQLVGAYKAGVLGSHLRPEL